MGTLSYMDANGVWQTTEDQPSGVQLTDGVIETRYLSDNAVTTIKLADGSVTNPKIVSMDAAKLTGVLDGNIINNGSISGNKLAIGAITSTYLSSDVNNAISSAGATANSKNTVYYQPGIPSGGTYKIGDTWFDTDDGYKIYVWNGTTWNNSQDAGISAAYTLASGKNKIYYAGAAPTGGTYINGDMWVNTSEGNKLYIRNGTQWVSAQDASIATAQTAANNAMTTANGKNTTYYQIAQPSGGTYKSGDLWFDTDDGNKPYIFNGSTWVANIDTSAGSPLSVANSKNKVYYQAAQPTGGTYLVGDLWFDSDDNYKQYVYTSTGWVVAQDSYTAQTTANSALTAANGKNKVVYSTSNPSGTGFADGDTWYKYDATGVIGFWRYGGGVWTQQTIQNAVFGNIDAGKITTGILDANLIAVNSLNGDRITANTLTASKLVAGTITAASGVIADAAITTAKIADLTVTNAKIGSLDAGKITTGYLDAARINANTITGTMIVGSTITTDKLASNVGSTLDISSNNAVTVMARKDSLISLINVSTEGITIAANRININGALQISNWAHASDTTKIDGGDIYTRSITASQIATGALTANEIAAATITANKLIVGTGANLFPDPLMLKSNIWDQPTYWGATTGHNGGGGITVPAGSVKRGTYLVFPDNRISVVPEQRYIIGAWVYTSELADTGTLRVYMDFYGPALDAPSKVTLNNGNPDPIPAATWRYVETTVDVPADKVAMNIGFFIEDVSGGATYTDSAIFSQPVVQGMVNTSLIVRGSITADSGIISSIDASTITVGMIDASRISLIPTSQLSGSIISEQLDSSVQSTLTSVSTKASSASLDATNSNVSSLATTTNSMKTDLDKLVNSIAISGAGVTNAISIAPDTGITIKQYDATGNSKFAINLDGDSLDFLEDTKPVARITSRNMQIANATISDGTNPGTLQVGAHKIEYQNGMTIFRGL